LESDTRKIAQHTLGIRLKIKNVTLGMMAFGVVLVNPFLVHGRCITDIRKASWAVLADNEFTPKGGVTRISWEILFDKIKSLAEKLGKTKRGKETLKIWNLYVFANTVDPDEGEEHDEGEDEFAQLKKNMELELEMEEGKFSSYNQLRPSCA
jgi:hypothetical protein